MKKTEPPGLHFRKSDIDGELQRSITLDTRLANTESRTVPATLSSDIPYRRWYGNEILRHDNESVDISRASEGLPLLWNHDDDQFIGVVRNVKVDSGKLRGVLHFSENTKAQEVFNDVSAGLLSNMSIGYRINEYEEDNDGNVTATRWEVFEASMAPVPADPSVGVNRSETDNKPAKRIPTMETNLEKTRAAEQERIAGIRGLFNQRWTEPKHIELMGKMITEGATLDEARSELLELIGMKGEPVNNASPEQKRSFDDSIDKRMEESLAVRFGIETDPKIIAHCRDHNEFGGQSLVEMARSWLAAKGFNARGSSRDIVGRAFTTRADSGDFPELLANVAYKSLLKAYWDAPETWRTWASTSSIQDFKLNHRVNLSEFDTLPVVAEGATYTEGTFTDLGERIQLATYGMNYTITREAIINDDVSAFTRIPTSMGLAAARTVGDLVYDVLTSNPTLNQDSTALFNAAHNNYVALGAGGIPDADSVQAAKVAMALQKGPKNAATLGIRPRYGICPVALEGTFNTLMNAQYNPATTAGTMEPNVVQGLLTVVSDHRLDTDNPAAWYVAAGQNEWDTVDVGFLNGNQTPYQERRQDDISNDNITYKVRIDAAAAPMDFRGLYLNEGA